MKVVLFLAIGLFLLWIIFKDADINEIKSILSNDFKYSWVIISLILGLISHISRTIRWKILIEGTGYTPSAKNTFLALMVGYLANMALPRMGEIVRCSVLAKYEKVAVSTLIGTVVFERVMDVLVLLLITLISVTTQFHVFVDFFKVHPEFLTNLNDFIASPWIFGGVAVVALIFFAAHLFMKHSSGYVKIKDILYNVWKGLSAIKTMKRKWTFLFHSIFIWVCYFLMNYAIFFAFDFTSSFGPLAALFVFVMGSYGMIAPVQGGFGPWHIMTIAALMLYGVGETESQAFALVAHESMTLMIILVGFISLIALPIVNRK